MSCKAKSLGETQMDQTGPMYRQPGKTRVSRIRYKVQSPARSFTSFVFLQFNTSNRAPFKISYSKTMDRLSASTKDQAVSNHSIVMNSDLQTDGSSDGRTRFLEMTAGSSNMTSASSFLEVNREDLIHSYSAHAKVGERIGGRFPGLRAWLFSTSVMWNNVHQTLCEWDTPAGDGTFGEKTSHAVVTKQLHDKRKIELANPSSYHVVDAPQSRDQSEASDTVVSDASKSRINNVKEKLDDVLDHVLVQNYKLYNVHHQIPKPNNVFARPKDAPNGAGTEQELSATDARRRKKFSNPARPNSKNARTRTQFHAECHLEESTALRGRSAELNERTLVLAEKAEQSETACRKESGLRKKWDVRVRQWTAYGDSNAELAECERRRREAGSRE